MNNNEAKPSFVRLYRFLCSKDIHANFSRANDPSADRFKNLKHKQGLPHANFKKIAEEGVNKPNTTVPAETQQPLCFCPSGSSPWKLLGMTKLHINQWHQRRMGEGSNTARKAAASSQPCTKSSGASRRGHWLYSAFPAESTLVQALTDFWR